MAFSQKTEREKLVWDSLVASLWHVVSLSVETLKSINFVFNKLLISSHFILSVSTVNRSDINLAHHRWPWSIYRYCLVEEVIVKTKKVKVKEGEKTKTRKWKLKQINESEN